MADPFATGLGTLFNGPRSVAADFLRGDDDPVPIRVVRTQPDEIGPIGRGRIVQATNHFEIRRSDVPDPAAGDRIQIGAETFALTGEPRLNGQGDKWACPANLVR